MKIIQYLLLLMLTSTIQASFNTQPTDNQKITHLLQRILQPHTIIYYHNSQAYLDDPTQQSDITIKPIGTMQSKNDTYRLTITTPTRTSTLEIPKEQIQEK